MQDTLTNNRIKLLRKKKVLSSPKPISITVNVSVEMFLKYSNKRIIKGLIKRNNM